MEEFGRQHLSPASAPLCEAIAAHQFSDLVRIPGHVFQLPQAMHTGFRAAVAAANVIRARFGESHAIVEKGVGDLVSQVDTEAEQAILRVLLEETPEATIISEESRHDIRPGNGQTWIVDPLDATSAFLFRAGPQYPSVMIALMEQGELNAGIVVFPLTGECFYSYRGVGAFKDGVPLRAPGSDTTLKDGWVDINQYGDSALETDTVRALRDTLRTSGRAKLVTSDVPHSGIALRILEKDGRDISAVIHDNNPRKVKQAPWDIAAPLAIVTAAGGSYLTLNGDHVDPFDCTPMVIARSERLAQEIITLAKRSSLEK